MSGLIKNSVTIIGLLLVAALGYYLFVLNSDSALDSQTRVEITEAQILNEKFVRQLNDIKTFELTEDIFVDSRFRSFVDFTTPVQPRPVGRENPFVPVE